MARRNDPLTTESPSQTMLVASRRQVWRRLVAGIAAVLALGFGLRRADASGPPPGGALCPTRDCGYEYDPALGDPERGILPGTPFDALPDEWLCPNCGTPKARW